jgi:hypothetical protein
VAIESKVGASLTSDQLKRHLRAVGRCFEKIHVVAITAESKPKDLPKGVPHRTWVDVYVWLGAQSERDGFWVRQMRDFMRVLESRLVNEGGGLPELLTMFDGIPFRADYPYSYPEAKLLIRQAIPLLRQRKALLGLGVDPECTGRSAITGKDSTRVWDFISLKPQVEIGGFTEWPHLTLGIHSTHTEVMVTMPNSIKGCCRQAFKDLGVHGFLEMTRRIEANMAKAFKSTPTAYKPVMRVVHRHYRSQRSEAELDGEMEVDLRTARTEGVGGVKTQPIWFEAAYRLITDRGGCNVQLQMGVNFPHSGGLIQGAGAVEVLESGWISCAPLVDILLKHKKK